MNDLKSIIEDVNKSDIIADKVIEKIIEKIGQEEWHLLHDEYSDIITTTGEVAISLRNLMYTEKENEQLKQQIEEMKNCYNCSNFCDRNVDCSSICVRNNPTLKQLKDYWKMKDVY